MIKAFYSKKNVRLFNGDVVETLDALPDECIDLIFADPPYNLSVLCAHHHRMAHFNDVKTGISIEKYLLKEAQCRM